MEPRKADNPMIDRTGNIRITYIYIYKGKGHPITGHTKGPEGE
jgi:hypothetical protein